MKGSMLRARTHNCCRGQAIHQLCTLHLQALRISQSAEDAEKSDLSTSCDPSHAAEAHPLRTNTTGMVYCPQQAQAPWPALPHHQHPPGNQANQTRLMVTKTTPNQCIL